MAHDFRPGTDDHAYGNGGKPADMVVYGHTAYAIPFSKNNGFYDASGYSVPEGTICLRAWADQERKFFQSS